MTDPFNTDDPTVQQLREDILAGERRYAFMPVWIDDDPALSTGWYVGLAIEDSPGYLRMPQYGLYCNRDECAKLAVMMNDNIALSRADAAYIVSTTVQGSVQQYIEKKHGLN